MRILEPDPDHFAGLALVKDLTWASGRSMLNSTFGAYASSGMLAMWTFMRPLRHHLLVNDKWRNLQ